MAHLRGRLRALSFTGCAPKGRGVKRAPPHDLVVFALAVEAFDVGRGLGFGVATLQNVVFCYVASVVIHNNLPAVAPCEVSVL